MKILQILFVFIKGKKKNNWHIYERVVYIIFYICAICLYIYIFFLKRSLLQRVKLHWQKNSLVSAAQYWMLKSEYICTDIDNLLNVGVEANSFDSHFSSCLKRDGCLCTFIINYLYKGVIISCILWRKKQRAVLCMEIDTYTNDV